MIHINFLIFLSQGYFWRILPKFQVIQVRQIPILKAKSLEDQYGFKAKKKVWTPLVGKCFLEAQTIYPPCGCRKTFLPEEGKSYGKWSELCPLDLSNSRCFIALSSCIAMAGNYVLYRLKADEGGGSRIFPNVKSNAQGVRHNRGLGACNFPPSPECNFKRFGGGGGGGFCRISKIIKCIKHMIFMILQTCLIPDISLKEGHISFNSLWVWLMKSFANWSDYPYTIS